MFSSLTPRFSRRGGVLQLNARAVDDKIAVGDGLTLVPSVSA
ncbi:hypothetical protein [Streptomyces sp. SID13031]|nr:hypothetical protein [Streptomyces sp. SID13031]